MKIKSFIIGLIIVFTIPILDYYYMHYIAKNVSIQLAEVDTSKTAFENEDLEGLVKDEKLKPGVNLLRSSNTRIWYLCFNGIGNEYKDLKFKVKGYTVVASFTKSPRENTYKCRKIYRLGYAGQMEDFKLIENGNEINFVEKFLSTKF
ncbi:hypothetical protein [Clostridium folliculivorans]|uniref:Uncharacterized protein n=1 Tax=Clostridium folliculivorans TaxID=2886038 RepID=A0A9W5Y1K0_9CLOT|nr:hypothetical protein [Clostridium folliculivorans]GKU25044.1 hypothetical protein CFOLD11_18700 [Clostridium folliculivorans]GKU31142.1 hypothetical protein CFB3_32490 [Clostridium folliculivorans]